MEDWYNFPLIYHGKVIDKADKICPQTVKILKKMPYIQIAGFSLLLPNSKLEIHNDETGKKNNSMACNLLLTDNNANLYLFKSGHKYKYKHKKGKTVIFDSNLKHYADNKDSKNRVILYIDFKTDVIIGSKIKGIQLASKLGYPTINIKLEKMYKCGVFKGKTDFGNVIVFVRNDNYAEYHYIDGDYRKDNNKQSYIYDLAPIEGEKNSIIDIYNNGCKIKI
jgi:hypothetical protein